MHHGGDRKRLPIAGTEDVESRQIPVEGRLAELRQRIGRRGALVEAPQQRPILVAQHGRGGKYAVALQDFEPTADVAADELRFIVQVADVLDTEPVTHVAEGRGPAPLRQDVR